MKIDRKKSGGDFPSVNTFPPKPTILLLDLSGLNLFGAVGGYQNWSKWFRPGFRPE
jgi:hypothetical protein